MVPKWEKKKANKKEKALVERFMEAGSFAVRGKNEGTYSKYHAKYYYKRGKKFDLYRIIWNRTKDKGILRSLGSLKYESDYGVKDLLLSTIPPRRRSYSRFLFLPKKYQLKARTPFAQLFSSKNKRLEKTHSFVSNIPYFIRRGVKLRDFQKWICSGNCNAYKQQIDS